MPVSIDNYNTTEYSTPLFANICYKDIHSVQRNTPASIIIQYSSSYTINLRVKQLLCEFEKLENNWDEEDAKAPAPKSIKNAQYFTNLLNNHGQKIYHTAPGPNGEIMLDIRSDNNLKSFEVIFYENKQVVVFFPNSTEKPFQKNFQFQKINEYLQWLNKN